MTTAAGRKALATAQHAVLACSGLGDVEDALLAPLARAIGADTATGLEMRTGRHGYVLGNAWGFRLPAGCQQRYAERFFALDPLVPHHFEVRRSQPRIAACGAQLAVNLYDASRLRSLAANGGPAATFFEQFLRPYAFGHGLTMSISLPALPDRVVVLAAHRQPHARRFDASEAACARALAPAITQALGSALLADAMLDARRLADAVGACLDHVGVAVLDGCGRILHCNSLARRHWVDRQSADEIAASVAASTRAARPAAANAPPRMPIADGEGRPLDARVHTIVTHAVRRHVVVTTAVSAGASLTARCRAAGLTGRQIEIAECVARGLSNPEIAIVLGISARTVENHLRSIFLKVGVESRARLAARLRS